MPRERLRPGEHGRITQRSSGGKFFASTYVRDSDGKRRRVERSSEKSAEDARRVLQRHLAKRRTPKTGQLVNEKTALGDLFDLWVETKAAEDGVKQQTVDQYRAVWRTHGAAQLGSLRVIELETQDAHNYIQGMASKSQAKRLRMVLTGMYSMACRFDVVPVNPIRETKQSAPAGESLAQPTRQSLDRSVPPFASTPSGRRRGRALDAFCPRS
ncbi:Putative phage integrase [Mycobacteroides abscessus]|nr:Putative phage integrase [Mycobacteroides abscessus]